MCGTEGKVDILYSGLLGSISPITGCSQQPPSCLSSPLMKQPAPFVPYRDKGGSQPGCLHKDTYSMSARWTGPALLSISSDWLVARSGPATGRRGSLTKTIFPAGPPETMECQMPGMRAPCSAVTD